MSGQRRTGLAARILPDVFFTQCRRRATILLFAAMLMCLLFSALSSSAQPVITQEPASQTVPPGQIVSISVAAQGADPIRYHWQFNGRWLAVRGPTLRFVASRFRAGTYRAFVRDASGRMVASTPAVLRIKQPPVILVQPGDTTVREHGTAVFTVRLNNSGPYTTIVWHNDNPLEGSHEIPDGIGLDVHSTRLVIPDCNNTDSYNGLYWLAVTNEVGGVVTRKARLTVLPAQ